MTSLFAYTLNGLVHVYANTFVKYDFHCLYQVTAFISVYDVFYYYYYYY